MNYFYILLYLIGILFSFVLFSYLEGKTNGAVDTRVAAEIILPFSLIWPIPISVMICMLIYKYTLKNIFIFFAGLGIKSYKKEGNLPVIPTYEDGYTSVKEVLSQNNGE